MKPMFENLQALGRALMLPVAVLPVAGLLLRFGQPRSPASFASWSRRPVRKP